MVVLSVLFEPSSLLQEMTVKPKRNMESMMSICLIRFLVGGYRRTQYISRFEGVLQELGILLGGRLTVTIIGYYQKMIHILNCPRETGG